MRPTIALMILTLPACSVAGAGPGSPSMAGAGKCDSTALTSYVGQTATAEIGAELLAKSGARMLRWGPPGAVMTMDFREDRLTVSYDQQMAITRLSCG